MFKYKESSILINVTKSRIEIFKKVHDNIIEMQIKSFTYINSKRKNAPLLKEKNKVYFLTKNFKKKNKNKKLNLIKVEIFYIKKVKKLKIYELNLLKDVKIHSILKISLLKLVDLNIFIQETFHYKKQKKEEFEIEKILKQKGN